MEVGIAKVAQLNPYVAQEIACTVESPPSAVVVDAAPPYAGPP